MPSSGERERLGQAAATDQVDSESIPAATGGFLAQYGLIRPQSDRKIAGVCAAIGNSTGTDPLLWRVLFAVLVVFAGAGLLFYTVAWLLFPQEGDKASAFESLFGGGHSSTSVVSTILLMIGGGVLFVIMVINSNGYPLIVFGILTVGLAAVAKSRGGSVAVTAQVAPSPEPVDTPGYRAPFAPGGPFARRTPELPATVELWQNEIEGATRELSAEPEVTDTVPDEPVAATVVAEPPAKPAKSKQKRPRSRLGLITFFLILVAMGVMTIVRVSGAQVPLEAFGSVALILCGLGLLAGTWWGRSRLLYLFGFVVSLGLVANFALETSRPPEGIVNTSMTPLSVEEIPPVWSSWLNDSDLDLQQISFADGDEVHVTVLVRGGAGDIFVPPELDVVIDADITGGTVAIWDRGPVSMPAELYESGTLESAGVDGPGGGTLFLEVTVEFGEFEVIR